MASHQRIFHFTKLMVTGNDHLASKWRRNTTAGWGGERQFAFIIIHFRHETNDRLHRIPILSYAVRKNGEL